MIETELSSSRRKTEQREVRGDPPGWSPWKVMGGVAGAGLLVGIGPAAAAVAGLGAVVGVNVAQVLSSIGAGAVGGVATVVRQVINEDKTACQELERHQNLLGNCVAEFAVFCRDHIDSVLSSELVEGEFRILLDLLRGARSPGAAKYAQVPMLLEEEVNLHDTRVSALMEQLRSSTANQKLSSIIQQILHELRESPNDEEIRTMIMNFIETKFTEACKS